MKATRKDVAKYAGVSEQTVSYILNNSRRFSPEIEKRVLEAVKKLNYVPNMAARSLSTKQTFSVSVIVHDISNPIFNEIMVGFQEAAHEYDYFVTVCDARGDIDKYVDNLIARNTEGVFIYVLAGYKDLSFIERLIDCGIKVVLGGNLQIESSRIQKNVSILDANHTIGMEKILKYLTELGHQDIVYLSGLDTQSTLDYRYKAFMKLCNAYNLNRSFVVENTKPFDTTPESGYDLTEKLIHSKKPFSAIVCTNDLMAYGAIEALKAHQYRVPEDVSVIGIDDLRFSKYHDPKLTTLGFDKTAFGRMVFQQLHSMIHEEAIPKTYLIDTQLVIRDSTKSK